MHNPGEKRAGSHQKSSGDGKRKWMEGMVMRDVEEVEAAGLECGFKEGRRSSGFGPRCLPG